MSKKITSAQLKKMIVQEVKRLREAEDLDGDDLNDHISRSMDSALESVDSALTSLRSCLIVAGGADLSGIEDIIAVLERCYEDILSYSEFSVK